MEKKQVLVNLIKSILCLLAGVQVLLGLVYVVLNITTVPGFAESQLLVQASMEFVLDEYMGILYPLLLRMTFLAGNNFCVLMYVLQLGVAFVSYGYFLRSVFERTFAQKKYMAYFWAAYIVTFPMVLQGHMCILPYSLASSMCVMVLAQLKRILWQKEPVQAKSVISIGIFWGLAGLILPDYGVMIGLAVAVGFAICGWKKKHRWGLLLLTLFITFACMGGVLSVVQVPGSLGRIQKSMGSVMLSRFAWPYIERNQFFWSEEVKNVFDQGELAQISMYPERIIYEFGPKLEEYVGKENANKLYWEMALDSLLIGKKEALTALGRDILNNAGGPIRAQVLWSGRSISYAGWNYAKMVEQAPGFTKYFVRFACYAFNFMLLLAVVVRVLQGKCFGESTHRIFYGLLFLMIGIITIWYTMVGNGMQDYLKVIPVNIWWCTLPVWGYALCRKHTGKE